MKSPFRGIVPVRRFWVEQSGATSVEWVVFCAAVVVLAATTIAAMQSASFGLSSAVSDYMIQIHTY